MKTPLAERRGLVAGLVLAFAAAAGCGRGGPERSVVTGMVAIDGRPIEMGEIRFIPIKGTNTPMWSAEIIDGRYRAFGKGGVPAGTHRIEFYAYVREDVDGADGLEICRIRQLLPAQFNVQSSYEITIEPGAPKVTKDFNL